MRSLLTLGVIGERQGAYRSEVDALVLLDRNEPGGVVGYFEFCFFLGVVSGQGKASPIASTKSTPVDL